MSESSLPLTRQENVHTTVPRFNFLPAKPHSSHYEEGTIENALPALARQHAAKLVGVRQTNSTSFASSPAVMTASPALASVSRTSSLPMQSHSAPPTSLSLGMTAPASTAPLSATTQLATMGVGVGPGINPNISNPSSNTSIQGSATAQNNPPIINTGNNGPMYVQPGDWVCSTCGFVNWRRRRVCMRCYPFADSNEMSKSIANGALMAAQLAAGYNPPAEMMASLAQPRRNATSTAQSALYAYDAQSAMPSGKDYTQYMLAAQHDSTSQTSMASYASIPAMWHSHGGDNNGSTTDAMLSRMTDSRLAVSNTAQYPPGVASLHQHVGAPTSQTPLRGTHAHVASHRKERSSADGSTEVMSSDAQRWIDETMSQIMGTTQAPPAIAHPNRPLLSRFGSSTTDFSGPSSISSPPSFSSAPRATDWGGVASSTSLAQHANAAPFKSLLSSSSAPFQTAADRNTAAGGHVQQVLGSQSRILHPIASFSSSPTRSHAAPHMPSASSAEFSTTVTPASVAATETMQYVSATDEQDEIVRSAWAGAHRRSNLALLAPAPSDAHATSTHSDVNESLASDKSRQAAIQPPGSRKDSGSTSSNSLSSWNGSSKSSFASLLE